ncbi:GMC oxidoreductase [Qipengyuania sphaerica]|uniref:GMC oxidoreductase n=1 Tax=Qipengyuania sphaerica TaxID=2867243 RepID=UPI001C86F3BF|nr:GMC oxidoreductase [Qipengyuania sphaerica]MBX7539506.1 hypothetical protein [Qipengyuania sphaerica]
MSDAPGPDVLVVGAGAVGIPLAVRLHRAGLRVVVIDAGPAQPDGSWQARNEGPEPLQPYPGLTEGRMKVVGGTTRLWGGQLNPFSRHDFARVDESGRQLWPIDWDEYCATLDAAYDILGVSEAARATDAVFARKSGSPVEFAEGLVAGLNLWLPQPDFAKFFETDIAKIDVRPATSARRISCGEDGICTVGLEGPGGSETFSPRHIVLAAGSIENSAILMRSAAIDPALPFAANAHLGAHYFDHLHGIVGTLAPADPRRIRALFDGIFEGGRKYGVKIKPSSPPPTRPSMAMTLNASTPGMIVRDALATGRRIGTAVQLARAIIPAAWRYVRHRRIASMFDDTIPLGIEVEQIAASERRVVLEDRVPPEEARAGVAWSVDPALVPHIADFVEEAGRSLVAAGLGKVTLDPAFAARDPGAISAFHDAYHHMGGTRMATSADSGVVDAECRVFGTANLHVAGASVFPTGSYANPTLTAIALGQRLADRLIEQCR